MRAGSIFLVQATAWKGRGLMIDIAKWNIFVEACLPLWEVNPVTESLLKTVGDQNISVALWGCLGNEVLDWLTYKVPALNKRRPIGLLKNETGRDEIRKILMSNPWWSALNRESPNS